jgi:Transposase DDE domain
MDIVQTVTTSLQHLLGTALDDLARQCGVVVRQRKFTGQTLLRMLVLTLLHKPDASAWDFLVTATQLGLDVTQTAVEKRFAAGQPLVDFLRQALERALRQAVASPPATAALLQRFTAVLLGDSTTVALPDELADAFPGCGGKEGTSGAALKIQVLWDLKTGRLERLLVEAGRASDAKSPIALDQAEPGTLLVYDLGYFDVGRFAALDRRQAQFLSRLQHGTTAYDADGVALDLVAFLRRQPAGLVDAPILLGATQRLRCRLIAVRVPEEVAARRRQQARQKARDHGREPSAAYLELLGWTLFVTNCAAAELTWQAVVVLYRARWQIELLFKLWKSHNGLARCRAGAPALEQLAVFYAKLLGVLLQHWLLLATAWLGRRRSLLKGARLLRDELKPLLLALNDGVQVEKELVRLRQLLQKLAQVKVRQKDPSHAQLLDAPELLDWLA